MFTLGVQAQLRVVIFGYDDFSGTRKIFESRLYDRRNIKAGLFFSDSLEVDVGNDLKVRKSIA